MAYPHHHQIVDLTGASAIAPGATVTVPNPVERVPHTIIADLVSGDARLTFSNITAASFDVTNPGSLPNESKLLVWHWHTRTR